MWPVCGEWILPSRPRLPCTAPSSIDRHAPASLSQIVHQVAVGHGEAEQPVPSIIAVSLDLVLQLLQPLGDVLDLHAIG